MKNQEIARILQNMIEEAEENLIRLAEAMTGYENLEHLDKRRAELKEAMALEAELLEALAILDAAPDIFARHAPATLETIKASAILGEALDARPKPPSGAESGETICYIGPGALSKEQIDIHIIRRYLDNAPRKSITDKNERLLAIASLDRLALLASRPAESAPAPREQMDYSKGFDDGRKYGLLEESSKKLQVMINASRQDFSAPELDKNFPPAESAKEEER
jgi:hypothetical protein